MAEDGRRGAAAVWQGARRVYEDGTAAKRDGAGRGSAREERGGSGDAGRESAAAEWAGNVYCASGAAPAWQVRRGSTSVGRACVAGGEGGGGAGGAGVHRGRRGEEAARAGGKCAVWLGKWTRRCTRAVAGAGWGSGAGRAEAHACVREVRGVRLANLRRSFRKSAHVGTDLGSG